MSHRSARSLTQALAQYVATLAPGDVPTAVRRRAVEMVLDGSGALLAAADPRLSTARRIVAFARGQGGAPQATVVGHGFRTGAALAALANGTMGYACDVEPHHPEGVLHPIAVMVPSALAMSEIAAASGERMMTAVVLGCEIEYRLSMALGPVEQYNLGFHPSAVCGCFGATAAAAFLLGLDTEKVERAFGLAGCQASGLMAWETDPSENARPFQMGMAARNGVTAAMLAGEGFGGPTGIFDSGHTVFGAFSRNPSPRRLVEDLGSKFDGIMELAIKPYSSVSFLHPALDALLGLARENELTITDIDRITLRFPSSGTHCIDDNPLKSHCAQYILPVALSSPGLDVIDLFVDRRDGDPEVRRLSQRVTVVRDDELDREFPARYASVIEVTTRDGRRFSRRNDVARGYPETPMSVEERVAKYERLAGAIASPARVAELKRTIEGLWQAPSITAYAALMGAPPDPSAR
ncbi:MAG TPA: MmgE/PrpD family protein [Alphaproteobacteria bacterium]|nr:MmgE/PrpD family protein [Alphaproteobacteria bacterium]